MKTYLELNVHQKIQIKQYAINLFGKRWHTSTPIFCNRLNELDIQTIIG